MCGIPLSTRRLSTFSYTDSFFLRRHYLSERRECEGPGADVMGLISTRGHCGAGFSSMDLLHGDAAAVLLSTLRCRDLATREIGITNICSAAPP